MHNEATNLRAVDRCDDSRPAVGHASTDKLSAFRRLGSSAKQFALAPFRVHHYRDVTSRMLREALCYTDCVSKSRD